MLSSRGSSLVAQVVKNLPATWETRVQPLVWEDPLEKGMPVYSNVLAWTREACWATFHGSQKWLSHQHTHKCLQAALTGSALENTSNHEEMRFSSKPKNWKVLGTQSCSTLCNPTDCSPPGFSVHGILQAQLLEWATIPFFRVSSQPRDWTQVSRIACRFFTRWATRETPRIERNEKSALGGSVSNQLSGQVESSSGETCLRLWNFEGAQGVKNTGFWPQMAEMHVKGMISVSPGSCIVPIHRKALNSLTWDIWFFFLIHKNTFDVQTTCLCYKLLYNLAPPLASSEQVFQGYLRYCLLGLSPKNVNWIQLSTFRLWLLFKSTVPFLIPTKNVIHLCEFLKLNLTRQTAGHNLQSKSGGEWFWFWLKFNNGLSVGTTQNRQ